MFKKTKLFKILFILILILNFFIPIIHADDLNETIEDYNKINDEVIKTTAKPISIPNINSRAAIVIDRKSNTILFGKNENSKRKMASTTKIMTCLIVIEQCNLEDSIEISKESASTGGSRLGLKTNDKITIKDLLYGLMLCSGNDAAVALAEHVGGNIQNFSILMNNKAKELELKNTNFETPHGLDSENHYTTAYELAILTNYALNNPIFAKIVNTKSCTITINGYPKTITNTNELLGNLNGVYGVKTGFTNGANRCLVTACKRNDLDIICVVLGADTKKFRTKDSINLIEYTFKNYEPFNIENLLNNKFNTWKENNLKDFSISKGENQNITLKLETLKNPVIPIKKENINNLQCIINCEKTLNAPLNSNTSIGNIKIYSNDTLISESKILIDCNINKKNILNYFINFFKNIKKIPENIYF